MRKVQPYIDGRKRGIDLFRRPSISSFAIYIIFLSALLLSSCQNQIKKEIVPTSPPKVTQIDLSGLENVLKPKGKPLLINFWATWCGPCREEFPDLVEIGRDHKEKIELITISLDEVSEINTTVPEFLGQMGSDSGAYLLKTPDQDAAINLVSKTWQGALPFTILIDENGQAVYSVQGKFKPNILIAEIEKATK